MYKLLFVLQDNAIDRDMYAGDKDAAGAGAWTLDN
jgi:hypothetical protein